MGVEVVFIVFVFFKEDAVEFLERRIIELYDSPASEPDDFSKPESTIRVFYKEVSD